MPEFRCRLATATGEVVERTYTAESAEALRRELEGQDYLVLSIRRQSPLVAALRDLFRRRRRVNMKEFLFFNQEFAALIRAGIPILEALALLIERRKNPVFREALREVHDRVKGGESLSEAFEAQEIFPPLYASTIASGERSGEVATVLQRYIRFTQTVMGIRRKVVSAFTYPAILVVMALGLTMVLMTYVLPKFKGFFSDFGAELPLLTRALLALSTAMREKALVWIGIVAVGLVAFLVWKRTPVGRVLTEKAVYRSPLVGPIAQQFVVTRFARTLATLVAGGIPLVSCLEIVARTIGTPVYGEALRTVALKVREGAALWSSLEETGLFPDMMIEMVKIGESSGSLAEMLEHVADFIDEEIEHRMQTLVSLVEPALLVFMAVMVGMMLLAIYYPLLQVYANSSTL